MKINDKHNLVYFKKFPYIKNGGEGANIVTGGS